MSEKSLGPARHEPTDVGARFIWIGTVVLIASVIFFGFVVVLLFPHALKDWSLHLPLPSYPAPRQQTDPRADMQKFYAEEMQRLDSAGWIDKANGIVRIPVDRALELVAKEGLPSRKKESSR